MALEERLLLKTNVYIGTNSHNIRQVNFWRSCGARNDGNYSRMLVDILDRDDHNRPWFVSPNLAAETWVKMNVVNLPAPDLILRPHKSLHFWFNITHHRSVPFCVTGHLRPKGRSFKPKPIRLELGNVMPNHAEHWPKINAIPRRIIEQPVHVFNKFTLRFGKRGAAGAARRPNGPDSETRFRSRINITLKKILVGSAYLLKVAKKINNSRMKIVAPLQYFMEPISYLSAKFNFPLRHLAAQNFGNRFEAHENLLIEQERMTTKQRTDIAASERF